MDKGDFTEEHTFVFEERNTTFFKRLEVLFEENSFSDVTLYCNGESITAHRVVLACYSPFFRKTLKDTSSYAKPTLVFCDISKNEMMYLIDYLYKGSVNVPKDFVSSFERLLNKFEVKGATHNGDTRNCAEEPMENDVTGYLSPDFATVEQNVVLHEQQNNSEMMIPGTSNEITTFNHASVEQKDQHKVINPYACKPKSPIRHDRSSSSPKKNAEREMSRRMSEDSDVEVIEKDGTVLVITDAQDSSSPDFCSKSRKRRKGEGVFVPNKVELTSDDSILTHSTPKKTRKVPRINDSEEDDQPALAPVTKGAARKSCWKSKAISEAVDAVAGTSNMGGGKTTGGLNSTQKNREMRKCVVCKRHKRHIVQHIKKYHKFQIRRKTLVCKKCFKKFGFEEFLKVHICKK